MAHLLRSTLFAALACASPLAAQDVTLKVHHFMAETSGLHADMLVPFKESIEAASEGRIAIELYASMSLGGRPGDLYDQAADGAVDVILTLPGYTAGRFNRTEVFELPFLMDDTVAGSMAFWDLVEAELQEEEYDETQILSAWVHSRGHLHSEEPIYTLEDLAGKEMRGPTRVVTDLLGELGATPVGMPLPLIPENLSKGVISGAALPWEITPSIRLAELVTNHTVIEEGPALYTATFILAMNRDVYDDMPDDLREILDAQTGKLMSEFAGSVMRNRDQVGRDAAAGNTFIELDEDELVRWVDAAGPVYDRWIDRAEDEGFDGSAAIDQAQDLIEANR
ncbi:TRAP transporter substrate-binding protein [Octadecabacter sp. G9-8]|uniref:TRAP transporter substrate-binding protein n=1 Tax=Octadecabacter dasysiphoniae TaxID=2909341 RepID=A0ABS9CW92_9RHOB|nr:TRAP transporter substrate-binding protein [Octadecabacter dasysiphoniae]MCF2871527.1 TRAP transporter substrate-binding protein [Octadecabacter dasysiphoniae]